MRVLENKRTKKAMRFYVNGFGFRQPYQIVVDGTVAMAALGYRMQLRERIPAYFGVPIQLFTTHCLLNELRVLGNEVKAAIPVLENLQQRNCHHSTPLSAKDCILDMIGESNANHLVVCTLDRGLIRELRNRPGVPILSLTKGHVTIQKPSHASLRASDQGQTQKVQLPEHEQEVLKKLSQRMLPPKQPRRPFQPKKKKNPNPLSCLKPKKDRKNDKAAKAGGNQPKRKIDDGKKTEKKQRPQKKNNEKGAAAGAGPA